MDINSYILGPIILLAIWGTLILLPGKLSLRAALFSALGFAVALVFQSWSSIFLDQLSLESQNIVSISFYNSITQGFLVSFLFIGIFSLDFYRFKPNSSKYHKWVRHTQKREMYLCLGFTMANFLYYMDSTTYHNESTTEMMAILKSSSLLIGFWAFNLVLNKYSGKVKQLVLLTISIFSCISLSFAGFELSSYLSFYSSSFSDPVLSMQSAVVLATGIAINVALTIWCISLQQEKLKLMHRLLQGFLRIQLKPILYGKIPETSIIQFPVDQNRQRTLNNLDFPIGIEIIKHLLILAIVADVIANIPYFTTSIGFAALVLGLGYVFYSIAKINRFSTVSGQTAFQTNENPNSYFIRGQNTSQVSNETKDSTDSDNDKKAA